MDFDFWDNCWQRESQPFHVAKPHQLLIKHYQTIFSKDHKVLVPLSGKTIDTLFLAEQGFQSVAIEFNPTAVEKFFLENNLNPTAQPLAKGMNSSEQDLSDIQLYQLPNIDLWQADFFAVTSQMVGSFTQVYDRASFVALPVEMRQQFAQHLQSLLLPNSVILMVTMDYDPEQMSGPPFHVTLHELKNCFPSATIEEIDRISLLDNHSRWQQLELEYLDEVLYLIQLP